MKPTQAFALILFLFDTVVLPGQSSFQKFYGDTDASFCKHVLRLPDSGFLLAGGVGIVETAASDAALVRLDSAGNVVWHKVYSEPLAGQFSLALPGNDSGFLLIGSRRTNNPPLVSTYITITKVDDDGNLLWTKFLSSGANCTAVRPVAGGYVLNSSRAFNAVLTKIDNDGDLVWSRRYSNPQGPNKFYDFLIEGDTLYTVGHFDDSGIFASIDLNDGSVYAARLLAEPIQNSYPLYKLLPTADGHLAANGLVPNPGPGQPNNFGISLQKFTREGAMLWSRMIYSDSLSLESLLLTETPDGGWFMSSISNVLLKTTSDGTVATAEQFRKNQLENIAALLPASDGGCMVGGAVRPADGVLKTALAKTRPDLRVEGCCTPVPFVKSKVLPVTSEFFVLETDTFPVSVVPHTLVVEERPLAPTDYCSYVPVEANAEVFFCPGDSIFLAGDWHHQPGTVMDTIPNPAGCDTIMTYTLQFNTPSQPSVVTIQCPADLTVTIPAASGSALVGYNAPATTTDCICGSAPSALIQGLAGGSQFPAGITQVCFLSSDECGASASCCFTVTVAQLADETACDHKASACVTFDLLGIFLETGGAKRYRLRVKNTCSAPLVYTAFQLPDGLTAIEPADASTYTTAGGNSYQVRNPNASPQHSIRFKAAGAGIANGQSDVFEYTLPEQADPGFIHVVARLQDQALYEAHLNVFNCPVQSGSADRTVGPPTAPALQIYPNPVYDILRVDLSAWANQTVQIRICDALGRIVTRQALSAAEDASITLPGKGTGLHTLELTDENGQRHSGRFARIW